jgi:aryl-alcohol dehydrogenase-like predicted oxidoreductase
VEDSLRRLDTDYIDLYQMHRPDHDTPIDETLGALSDLVREGKVRAIGSSFFSPEETVEAQWTAERRGHHRFRTEQPPYSILTRGIENRVLPTAQRYGLGVLTFGPLNSGWLSGRADPTAGHRNAGIGAQMFDLSRPGVQAKADAVEKLTKVAADAGLPLSHLAIAFVRAHPAVTSVLIGPRRPEHLADLLAGADVELDDAVLDRIDEIVPPGVDVHSGDFYISPAPAILDKRLRRR